MLLEAVRELRLSRNNLTDSGSGVTSRSVQYLSRRVFAAEAPFEEVEGERVDKAKLEIWQSNRTSENFSSFLLLHPEHAIDTM